MKALRASSGGAWWYGCAEHYPAMSRALEAGLPGIVSGGAWVDVVDLAAAA